MDRRMVTIGGHGDGVDSVLDHVLLAAFSRAAFPRPSGVHLIPEAVGIPPRSSACGHWSAANIVRMLVCSVRSTRLRQASGDGPRRGYSRSGALRLLRGARIHGRGVQSQGTAIICACR